MMNELWLRVVADAAVPTFPADDQQQSPSLGRNSDAHPLLQLVHSLPRRVARFRGSFEQGIVREIHSSAGFLCPMQRELASVRTLCRASLHLPSLPREYDDLIMTSFNLNVRNLKFKDEKRSEMGAWYR